MSDLAAVHSAMLKMPHEDYCRKLMSIVGENEQVAKLDPSPTQKKVIEIMKKQLSHGRKHSMRVRLFVLKARRVRCTTISTSWAFRQYAHNPNCSIELTGDVMKQGEYMMGMMKHYYRYYGVPGFLPKLETDNIQEMKFNGWNDNCSIRMSSADNPEKVCRGQRVSVWVATEFPLWHSPKAVYQAALPACKDGHIILEGTANGRNESYDIWESAKRGDTDLEPVLIGWTENPDYRIPCKGVISRYDKEEQTLRRMFQIDDDQIAWRRKMIAEMGSLTAFHHEFPAFEHEAWESSSASYFDQSVVSERLASAVKPSAIGLLEEDHDTVVMRCGHDLPLSVWSAPVPDAKYLISADIAGARTGLKRDNDQSVAMVFSLNPFKQVGTFTYRASELQFAADLHLLSRYYNDALIVPERNNAGTAVVQWLKDHDANLWEMEYNNKWSPEYAGFPGWVTSQKTRPLMLADLRAFVKDSPSTFVDSRFWDECNTFVYRNGRYEADSGRHDDFVFAAAIAVQVYKSMKEVGPSRSSVTTDKLEGSDWLKAFAQKPVLLYGDDGRLRVGGQLQHYKKPASRHSLGVAV